MCLFGLPVEHSGKARASGRPTQGPASLENARLLDETQRGAREAAALAEVGRDLSSSLELSAVMDGIARHARELLAGDNSAIWARLPDDTHCEHRRG